MSWLSGFISQCYTVEGNMEMYQIEESRFGLIITNMLIAVVEWKLGGGWSGWDIGKWVVSGGRSRC